MLANSILVYLDSVFLFSFNKFIFMFNPLTISFNYYFFHSKISIFYPITGCLCNNYIFIQQYVFDSIIINHSMIWIFVQFCCFINFNNVTQKFHFHSKALISLKNFMFTEKLIFIQKLYFH